MRHILFATLFLLTSCSNPPSLKTVGKWIKTINNELQSQQKSDRKNKNFDNSYIEKGDSVVAKIIKIHDGDTYDALLDLDTLKVTIRIRMDGIDAPEGGMPFYRKSKNYLRDLAIQKTVGIKVNDIDHYDRAIAYTYLEDGRELSREMIRAGLAWHYKQYNKNKELAELEIQAKTAKLGVWVDDNPIPPWEVRKLHRQGISTKDKLDISEGRE